MLKFSESHNRNKRMIFISYIIYDKDIYIHIIETESLNYIIKYNNIITI